MSQDDEESNNHKPNNNHHNYSNNSDYNRTSKKTGNNQQVVPLYENCTLHNNNNNTNNKKPDHNTTVEQTLSKSDTFNNIYRFVGNTTNGADVHEHRQETCDTFSLSTEDEYETISYRDKEYFDKKILLQKYFRSALVGPRTNIYENLCRGCNYGVFSARGPLCTFCECIVNGVNALRSETSETSITTSNNIYENICEHCGLIYSGNNSEECKCRQVKETEKSEEDLLALGSEELLIEKSVKEKKKVKINKSKSFNKCNKPKIFTNLWDTIRKPKNRKNLEIIHHVEGYEQVFHTKETFDLQRICELKRLGSSCSDQHIYGRLKQTELGFSQDDFSSTQSLTQSAKSLGSVTGKKPRNSKAKFLRSQPSDSLSNLELLNNVKPEVNAATLYLNNSVCQWMTSLRREIHTYNTFAFGGNEIDQETLCYPKSIPSKNVLDSCRAPVAMNHTKIVQNFKLLDQQPKSFSDYGNITEIDSLPTHKAGKFTDSWKFEQEIEDEGEKVDCYQEMVKHFMVNIVNRKMLKTKENKQQVSNVNAVTAVNGNDMYTHNNNYSDSDSTTTTEIPLRQANWTSTTTGMTTHNHNSNNNKYKRQGMYLRLEDHQQLQQHDGLDQMNIHNANNHKKNYVYPPTEQSVQQGETVKTQIEYDNIENENLADRGTENHTVTTPDTGLTAFENDFETSDSSWNLIKADKRRGIHERNVLEAFEALLAQEANKQTSPTNKCQHLDVKPINGAVVQESQECEEIFITLEMSALQLQTFGGNPQSITQFFPTQILDVIQMINQQQLAAGLNTAIICYDTYLKVFLHHFYGKNKNTRTNIYTVPNKQLLRKFKQFYNYCEKTSTAIATAATMKPKTTVRDMTYVSSNLKLDLNVTYDLNNAQERFKHNESLIRNTNTAYGLEKDNSRNNLVTTNLESGEKQNQKVKTPPQVPKRDPKTKLSPTAEIKRIIAYKMTVPPNNSKTKTRSFNNEEEESIYQPIWKFETKGKVPELYRTDDDYYDLKVLKEKMQQESPNLEMPKILIADDMLQEEEEDHNNWEPDEEFVFAKQMKKQRSSSLTSERNSTIRSNHSSNSSIDTPSSLSGSTITEFASSTATLASTVSSSLRHYLFRNIGIFYSLTEPKLRAIIYDYDRIHSSKYFAKPLEQSLNINDSGIGQSLSPLQCLKQRNNTKSSSSSSSPSQSTTSSPVSLSKREISSKTTCVGISESFKFTGAKAKVSMTSPPPLRLIPSSVQSWKYQLLDVNYMEDEEDMIVSECEILRAQQIKEDNDQSPQTQPPQQFMQRFKSRSTENFLDLPSEDDKKTIAERLANMYTRFSPIQRGILNINGRNSPKSEKKAYKLHRASQSTSLYLEDGLKPKYPVFAAPLDQLELQQNVPRFVVDAIDYIERKDRITQDGIYRACGNKFSIDELKQKLMKSYIYDSKLIAADDIHTVTSLLKQFFRDLPAPVIPQDIYNRITANLADKQSVDAIRIAIEEMKEPNKSTLRFLIKHLTNVAACSASNRMNASNVAIVWGPSLFAQNDTYDMIGRMNTLTKVLIENYDRIFDTNERLL